MGELLNSMGWEAIAGFATVVTTVLISLIAYGAKIWGNVEKMGQQLTSHSNFLEKFSKDLDLIKTGDEEQSVLIKENRTKIDNLEGLLPEMRKIASMHELLVRIDTTTRKTNGSVIKHTADIDNLKECVKDIYQQLREL